MKAVALWDRVFNMKNSSLCVLPFINLSTRPNGQPRICSEGNHKFMPPVVNLNETSLDEFWNSKFLQQFRNGMIKDIPHPYCEICTHIENNGGISKRNSVNNQYLERYQHIIEFAKNNNGAVPDTPMQWEFRLSNKCNLACLTCFPTNSSLIESQHLKNFNLLSKEDKEIVSYSSRQKNKADFIEQIWEHIEHIDRIELHGGEPFYDENCLNILERISKEFPNNNIELLVHTNMTFMNQRIINILNSFKNVNFQMSIDGFGHENDFIRWPSKWKNIEKNLEIANNELITINKMVTITVSAYNCLSLDVLLKWIVEKYNFDVHWFPAIFPKRTNLSLVPLEQRIHQVEKLENLKPLCNNMTSKNLDQIIPYLLKDTILDSKTTDSFVDYCNLMDGIRKQNTLKTFPHLEPIFNRYSKVK